MDANPPAQPVTPADLPPDAPPTLGDWLRANAVSLAVTVALIVVVFVKWDPLTVLKVGLGLGLVVFIHELGHFLAAKWCDVHVETFSIGFGPPVPGCAFRYGETRYMLALIPLGGYVKMVGEGDLEEGGEDDPRSFKNKSVGQRMLIISAGVTMNILLAAVCFVFVYMTRGVEEQPAVVGATQPGAPAWVQGLPSGAIIDQVGTKENPWFNNIQQQLMRAPKGEPVRLVYHLPGGPQREMLVEPAENRDENPLPYIGVVSTSKLTLIKEGRTATPPVLPDSAAARAAPAFAHEDAIVACTDPEKGGQVTTLPDDPRAPPGTQPDYFEFVKRQQQLAGKPMVLRVQRGDGAVNITVPPAYAVTVGARMGMGKVAAVRLGSPAEQAGLQPDGDTIVAAEVLDPAGKPLGKLADTPKPGEQQLDPIKLPFDLLRLTEGQPPGCQVRLTVQRLVGHNPQQEVPVTLAWDEAWRYQRDVPSTPSQPMSVPCLGLAYKVKTLVADVALDPSIPEEKRLHRDDEIKKVRIRNRLPGGKIDERWVDVKADQWAYFFTQLQLADFRDLGFKVQRAGVTELVEVEATAREDKDWPVFERGILFQPDKRPQKAEGVLDALGMGCRRTVDTIFMIYSNLKAMVVGRVSVWSLSGPLGIAQVSYKIAGDNMFDFILFLGMINVNLAVINFLPIPVLDGGHMCFLIYEKVAGRPPPEKLHMILTYTGFALIVCLMLFVIGLDVWRLIS